MNPNDSTMNNTVLKSHNAKKSLIITLCIEIVVIIGLLIPIIINILNNKSTSQSESNVASIISEQDIVDTRPDCVIDDTTDEPFASIYTDYPNAGIYESTGKYFCNTDQNYKVKIPQTISKVYYYTTNGGGVGIVGLKTNEELLSAPITQTNFTFAAAGNMNMTTHSAVEQMLSAEVYKNMYTIVFEDATPELLRKKGEDKETDAMINYLYGEETSFVILFNSQVNPELYEKHAPTGTIAPETLEEMRRAYNNKNIDLNKLVKEIFANPDNYSKLENLDN